MPRQPRFVLSGVATHVVQRGNNRAACFLEEGDYRVYLAQLRELAKKLHCSVHAYCLMTNHVHLLLTPDSAAACAALMRDLGQRYVQYFNRRHERSGTLWEGRFRSCITESARYVFACYRYIELNPVRAGMVVHPSQYPWSSYAANCGDRPDALVSPHSVFESLGRDNYRRLVDEAIDARLLSEIRAATNGGYPLASDGFKSAVLQPLGRKLEPGLPGRPSKPGDEEKSGSDPDLFSAGGAS